MCGSFGPPAKARQMLVRHTHLGLVEHTHIGPEDIAETKHIPSEHVPMQLEPRA